MIFTDAQVEQLLKDIHPSRVKTTQGMAYCEQHDIRAHMNRVFGFGNWDQELTRLEVVFEQPTVIRDKQTGEPKPDRWDACYSASVKLTVRGGLWVTNNAPRCSYEDAATGYAQNQSRGEAHDLALKSAVSTALKRAATSLGDQFGLSLYAGSPKGIVRGVIGWQPRPNLPEGWSDFLAACEEKNLPVDAVEALFEERFGKPPRLCDTEELSSFVSLLRTGAISIEVTAA